MNFGVIFLVFGLQIVLALIVIVVLKKLLDRELVESALEQFEVLKSDGDPSLLKTIAVVSHKPLNAEIQSRFKNVAARRFKGVSIDFSTETALKGGVKVTAGKMEIDCSLNDRLERLFAPNR